MTDDRKSQTKAVKARSKAEAERKVVASYRDVHIARVSAERFPAGADYNVNWLVTVWFE
jgi:hypothetical protein